jgi:nucleotide-binding universal stress UspA family protein
MKEVKIKEHTKRILVPMDFSEQAIVGLDHAAMLAKELDAEIVMLSVVEESSNLSGIIGKALDMDAATINILKQQDELFSQYQKKGIRMEPMVSRGSVYKEIIRVSEMLAPELLVMSTNGTPHDMSKRFVGSNAYRVAREVKVPVVTVHGQVPVKSIKKIVFPFMLERKSREKVGLCLHYARIFNAQIDVVALASNDAEEKTLNVQTKQLMDFITSHGVDATVHTEFANGRSLPKALLDYNKILNGDIIVIMEDESVVPFHLWASDLEEVIYNAKVPVLCVTPSPAKYGSGFSNF